MLVWGEVGLDIEEEKASIYFIFISHHQNVEHHKVYIYKINSIEQSPSWEANSHSASQETTCFFWNPKVHYCVHKGLPLAPVLDHMHPVHTLPPYFPTIHQIFALPIYLLTVSFQLFQPSDNGHYYSQLL